VWRAASLFILPRVTRGVCAVLVIFLRSEVLQMAYARAEARVSG